MIYIIKTINDRKALYVINSTKNINIRYVNLKDHVLGEIKFIDYIYFLDSVLLEACFYKHLEMDYDETSLQAKMHDNSPERILETITNCLNSERMCSNKDCIHLKILINKECIDLTPNKQFILQVYPSGENFQSIISTRRQSYIIH